MGIIPETMRRIVALSLIKSSRGCRPPLTYKIPASFPPSARFGSSSSLQNKSEEEQKPDDRIDKFLDPQVQRLLRSLTGLDFKVIFRRRNLGGKLQEPKYTFMTAEQLEEAVDEANAKAEELLQIPPVLRPRKPINKQISFDPVLQGLEKDGTTLLFTDITQNIPDRDRLIVARESDGTLRHATWDERDKLNKIYFPSPGKWFLTPKMFSDPEVLMGVLARASAEDNSYVFVLDRACLQFEPDDPLFISTVEKTYDVIDSKKDYDFLRSTRHYGGMVFYLARLRRIDRLLCFLINNERIPEASDLISLFCILFPECKTAQTKTSDPVEKIRMYIDSDAILAAECRLHLNAYVEEQKAKEELQKGIVKAHGF